MRPAGVEVCVRGCVCTLLKRLIANMLRVYQVSTKTTTTTRANKTKPVFSAK